MIPLYWWHGHSNLGDELSPYLVEKITKVKVRYISQREYSSVKLVAIGSLLSDDLLHHSFTVWGTGTLTKGSFGHRNIPCKSVKWFPLNKKLKSLFFHYKQPDIRAVRGPITRNLLIKNGYACPNIFGDPAILLPDYYQSSYVKKHQIGLILHQSHSNISINLCECNDKDICLISINRQSFKDIEQFIDEVCSCQRIFSTSLHGIIVAQAYGIPAQWIRINNKPIHKDEEMKFEDYFLGAYQESQKPLEFSELNSESIKKIASYQPCDVKNLRGGKNALLNTFPFDIL